MPIYKPGSSVVLFREYLCDCDQCLQFNFEKCNKIIESVTNAAISYEEECNLDLDDIDEARKKFEFVTVPSFVALVSGDPNEPVYILQVGEKGEAESEKTDPIGHVIATGELYIRGNYLKMERSRSNKFHKFSVLPYDVLITPDEVFDVFVDIKEDLTFEKELFRELVARASEV